MRFHHSRTSHWHAKRWWSPRYIFHSHWWSDFCFACSECFPKLLGKVQLLLLVFPTMYFAEQGVSQGLHMRNKYCNRLDMNKTRQMPNVLSSPTSLATCFEKACNKHNRKVHISWNQLHRLSEFFQSTWPR